MPSYKEILDFLKNNAGYITGGALGATAGGIGGAYLGSQFGQKTLGAILGATGGGSLGAFGGNALQDLYKAKNQSLPKAQEENEILAARLAQAEAERDEANKTVVEKLMEWWNKDKLDSASKPPTDAELEQAHAATNARRLENKHNTQDAARRKMHKDVFGYNSPEAVAKMQKRQEISQQLKKLNNSIDEKSRRNGNVQEAALNQAFELLKQGLRPIQRWTE